MEQKELVDWFCSLQPLLDKELIDRWALGIVLYSMLIGSGPFRFQGRNSNLLYRDIKEKEVTFPIEKVFKIFCPPTICLLVLGADQRISRGCPRVFDKGRRERIPLWSTETRFVRECTEEKMRNLMLMWILNLPVEEWTTDATVRIGKVPCGVMGHPPTHIYPDPATSHKTPLPSQYLKIYWLNTVFVNSTNISTNIYPAPATSQSPRTIFFNQIISGQGRGVLCARTLALYLWTHRSPHLVVFRDNVCRKLSIN